MRRLFRVGSLAKLNVSGVQVCGHITCASCSKTRVHLPTSRSGQAKRVCDSCVPGVRAGLKSGEVMKEASDVDDDIGLVDSEEEHKAAAGGGLIASNRMSHEHAVAAAAAAAAVQATNARAPTDRKVHLLTAEEEAEIVNDSLAEAGF